ncbi:MAG: glycerophosphodiester phosphodiesterase [Candidatus Hodarchaeota archaeon]
MKSEFLFIGHRGTRTDFDENTIIAFEKAIEYGANYIELDVRKTKDGQLIIIHDSTLDRTTNGTGRLDNYTYDELKTIKTKKSHKQIPLLSEVLERLNGKIQFMIELKEEHLYDKIIKLIKENELMEDYIISGRDIHILKLVKAKLPICRICYNITKAQEFKLDEFLKQGVQKRLIFKPDMISLRSSMVSSEFIDICHDNEILSLSWDFIASENPLKLIKSLINIGIDGILFDNYKNISKIKQWVKSKL